MVALENVSGCRAVFLKLYLGVHDYACCVSNKGAGETIVLVYPLCLVGPIGPRFRAYLVPALPLICPDSKPVSDGGSIPADWRA